MTRARSRGSCKSCNRAILCPHVGRSLAQHGNRFEQVPPPRERFGGCHQTENYPCGQASGGNHSDWQVGLFVECKDGNVHRLYETDCCEEHIYALPFGIFGRDNSQARANALRQNVPSGRLFDFAHGKIEPIDEIGRWRNNRCRSNPIGDKPVMPCPRQPCAGCPYRRTRAIQGHVCRRSCRFRAQIR